MWLAVEGWYIRTADHVKLSLHAYSIVDHVNSGSTTCSNYCITICCIDPHSSQDRCQQPLPAQWRILKSSWSGTGAIQGRLRWRATSATGSQSNWTQSLLFHHDLNGRLIFDCGIYYLKFIEWWLYFLSIVTTSYRQPFRYFLQPWGRVLNRSHIKRRSVRVQVYRWRRVAPWPRQAVHL